MSGRLSIHRAVESTTIVVTVVEREWIAPQPWRAVVGDVARIWLRPWRARRVERLVVAALADVATAYQDNPTRLMSQIRGGES